MAQDRRNLWRSLTRRFGADKDVLVLDRRQRERRQRVQAVEEERRGADRRRPQRSELSEVRAFLGEGAQFKGELSFTGTFRVDGHLEGESVRGDVLIIGERGQVTAELEVGILQVSGQVQGNITARQWAEFLRPSRVAGTIRTPRLVIWHGALFNGRCEMPST